MSTHQQLLYHITFATKNRKPYLQDGFREKLFAYMAGTVNDLGGHAHVIGGFYDHVHLLIRIPAKTSVSEFVGKVKSNSSRHATASQFKILKFGWQDGFGAFTVSPSQMARVAAYIANQIKHHRKESLEKEYVRLLQKHGIEFDEKYLWG
jgi:REP element-mobilizing transposase RayT